MPTFRTRTVTRNAGIDKIYYFREKKAPRLLIFGYPKEAATVGGRAYRT